MKPAPTGVTDDVICGEFSDAPGSLEPPGFIRALTWNIERGVRFDSIFAFLRKCEADVILLQETDLNARCSAYRDVARELAQSLCLNYVFGLQFQELSSPHGMTPAYQGLATLSPWPLSNGRVIRFRRQSKFWLPRPYIPQMEIFQRRLGGRIALVCEVAIGLRRLVAWNVHRESRGADGLRIDQLKETVADAQRYRDKVPSVIGGDFNLVASQGTAAQVLGEAAFTMPSVRGLPPRGARDPDALTGSLCEAARPKVAQCTPRSMDPTISLYRQRSTEHDC
jgi:endonuclease/exonuclease/phosphatase family metal-dependent hydrolase